MTTETKTDNSAALRSADAVKRVCDHRHDFGGIIWQGYRDMIKKSRGGGPFVGQSNLQMALQMGSGESLEKAKLEFVECVL